VSEPELHGVRRQPFSSFDESSVYMERVTITDAQEAGELMDQEIGGCEDFTPFAIFMRYITGEEAEEWSGGEFDEAWIECEEDHADAVPYWKCGEE